MPGEEEEKPLAVVVGASRGLGLAVSETTEKAKKGRARIGRRKLKTQKTSTSLFPKKNNSQLALALASKGYHVLATVRASSAAPVSPTGAEALLSERGIEVVTGIDVTKSNTPKSRGSGCGSEEGKEEGEEEKGCEARLRAALRGRPVSLAVFNAAVMAVERDLVSGRGFDEEASRRQYESNALGFLKASAALVPALVQQASMMSSSPSSPSPSPPESEGRELQQQQTTPKLVLVSSKMASLGRLSEAPGGGMYGYRASKAAANAIALSLSRDLLGSKVAVGMVHPGTVATDMYREYHGGGGSRDLVPSAGLSSPEAAAEAVVRVIDERVSLERTGVFWDEAGEVLPY